MEFTSEQKAYAQIVQKAWEDSQFKNDLISNPVETLERFTGNKITIPEGKTLVVRDQSDESTIYLNIPAQPNLDNLALSEEQLEQVAGGFTFTIFATIAVTDGLAAIGLGVGIYAAVK